MVKEKVFLAKRIYKSPKQLLCFLPFLVPEEMQRVAGSHRSLYRYRH